jgi:hypothetical protein
MANIKYEVYQDTLTGDWKIKVISGSAAIVTTTLPTDTLRQVTELESV